MSGHHSALPARPRVSEAAPQHVQGAGFCPSVLSSQVTPALRHHPPTQPDGGDLFICAFVRLAPTPATHAAPPTSEAPPPRRVSCGFLQPIVHIPEPLSGGLSSNPLYLRGNSSASCVAHWPYSPPPTQHPQTESKCVHWEMFTFEPQVPHPKYPIMLNKFGLFGTFSFLS